MLGSDSKTIKHHEFGEITITKRKGIRRINMSIKPSREIVVSQPYYVSYAEAEKFIEQKSDWIRKSLQEFSKAKKPVFDENTNFSTKFHKLRILPHGEKNVLCKTNKEFVDIFYPCTEDLKSERMQSIIQKCLTAVFRAEAKIYLPNRLQYLANKFGFKYNGLTIKQNQSNLGSCSYTNHINLSLHIMRLEDELIDYVILHELCHTVEKNHGDGFWRLMDSVTNNCAHQLSARAKKINTRWIE